MDRAAQQKQANEIAHRINNGETLNHLANEYGLDRTTIWRRNNQGQAALMPDKDDTEAWREQLTSTLTTRIVEASERGDDKALVALVDRLNKMNGYDQTHRIELAKLQLDTIRVKMLAERMATALDTVGIEPERQVAILELISGG